ncbi:MAG: hypothetical protein ACOX65_03750, partial [Anaerotruncus rubiinfantis]
GALNLKRPPQKLRGPFWVAFMAVRFMPLGTVNPHDGALPYGNIFAAFTNAKTSEKTGAW